MITALVFVVVAGLSIGYAARNFWQIRQNILLGQPEAITGATAVRWRNVALVALGQSKMFKRWLPAVFHLFIYLAFVVTQVELVEIFVDGLFGTHRFFQPYLGGFYTFVIGLIEALSVLALVATVIFLARRNVLKIARFQQPEMQGWPSRDANIILYLEIVLVVCILLMNSTDLALHPGSDHFWISQWLAPLWQGVPEPTLHLLERVGWWGHILVVFAFLNYLPFSKHLHILLAFPNTYYAKQTPRGEMENMPAIMQEVQSMLGISPATPAVESTGTDQLEFGSNDVLSLSWKNLLDAYSCTECGRCTAVCPANLTGKKLSPRKVMMDIRDRATAVGQKIVTGNAEFARDKSLPLSKSNFDDGKSLFDYISAEELHACTTCNACVEACPVLINPLDPILKMRRYEILTLSQGPSDWIPLFNSMENSGAVWAMSAERAAWANE